MIQPATLVTHPTRRNGRRNSSRHDDTGGHRVQPVGRQFGSFVGDEAHVGDIAHPGAIRSKRQRRGVSERKLIIELGLLLANFRSVPDHSDFGARKLRKGEIGFHQKNQPSVVRPPTTFRLSLGRWTTHFLQNRFSVCPYDLADAS